MAEVIASFSMTYADRLPFEGESPQAAETALTGSHPGYRVYEAQDGTYLTVAALEERFWKNLCEALDVPEFAHDCVGFGQNISADRREEIVRTLEARFSDRPRVEWLSILDEHDVPAGPVNDFESVFSDPHLNARETFASSGGGDSGGWSIDDVTFQHTFGSPASDGKTPAPELGADTAALLEEVGYTPARVAELAADGVVRTGPK
jgi:crotonobetainyl-CoA:carnitine CoA-transferase CaiB-like acyl-CoA transferase